MRQQLQEYIKIADEKKVRALYTIIAPQESVTTEWWQDEQLISAMKKQDAAMESGKDKGTPWEEAKKRVMQRIEK